MSFPHHTSRCSCKVMTNKRRLLSRIRHNNWYSLRKRQWRTAMNKSNASLIAAHNSTQPLYLLRPVPSDHSPTSTFTSRFYHSLIFMVSHTIQKNRTPRDFATRPSSSPEKMYAISDQPQPVHLPSGSAACALPRITQ